MNQIFIHSIKPKDYPSKSYKSGFTRFLFILIKNSMNFELNWIFLNIEL
jgi:hypothetical protein